MIGHLPLGTAATAFGLALIAALGGGALGGVLVGGKHIGPGVAAIMGAFYGPMAGLAGVGLGLLVLAVI